MQLSSALAFFEIGNGPGLFIVMLSPAVCGLAALAAAIALFMSASKAKTEEGRIGWNALALFFLLVAVGIGACYGYVIVGLNTPGW